MCFVFVFICALFMVSEFVLMSVLLTGFFLASGCLCCSGCVGCCDFCLICDACSWRCSFMGSNIFEKMLDLFKIYALKHTEVTIYLTILLQERIVIVYQIVPSRISSQIIGYLMLLCNVYAPIQF